MSEFGIVLIVLGLFPVFFISFLCAALELRASVFKSMCVCVLNMAFAFASFILFLWSFKMFALCFFCLFALLQVLLCLEILWSCGGVEGVKKSLGRSVFCLVAGDIVFVIYSVFIQRLLANLAA